jgi:hypothetical protein
MGAAAAADRRLRLSLGLWASALFALLWAGVVISSLSGGGIANDAWRALTELPPVVALAAWLLCLPIPVALWTSQSGLPTILVAFVVMGLVAWTTVAWVGLARTLGARGRS